MHAEELTAPKNKLYTKGYFIKRMRDSGLQVYPLVDYSSGRFYAEEVRKWTVIVNPSQCDILLTCCKASKDDFWFKLSTPGGDLKVRTLSAEVLANHLWSVVNDAIDSLEKDK